MPSSRESVLALQAQGYSQAEIASTIQRDARVVRQILSGAKPYRNLEGPLSELAARGSAPVAGPERRQTATGEVARTRGGTIGRTRSGGKVWSGGGAIDPRREIERAASKGHQVRIRIWARYVKKYRQPPQIPGYVDLYAKGGYDASKVLRALDSTGEPDVRRALRGLALERGEDIEAVEKVYQIDIVSGAWNQV